MKKVILTLLVLAVVGVLALALLIQLIPYGKDHSNPPVSSELAWDSPHTRDLAKRACFDCHSNETVWPWYANIAPVSWLIQHDVDEGRQTLNFSDWQGIRRGEHIGGEGMSELGESIQEGHMPPSYYVVLHPTAKLSPAEKSELVHGLASSVK